MKKYFLTFHTIFIMDEHVEWIEEFLIYYINLGFEQFYLYDNTGSIGNNRGGPRAAPSPRKARRNGETTKYGFPIIKKDPEIWRHIYNKYEKYITYIKWQPTNEQGQIVYGINNSALDGIIKFIKDFKHEAEWCYVGDFDEFVFSPTNDDLLTLINSTTQPIITLHQKIFSHKCLTSEKFITQEFKCINIPKPFDNTYGGQKNIIKLDLISGVRSCHSFKGRNKVMPLEQWRFNHYNFCPRSKKRLDKQKWKYELSVDDSMKKYKNLFNET